MTKNTTLSHLIETELTSESVFDGVLLHVRRDTVGLPNQQQSIREYIRHPGAVAIVARLENGELLLERQFRYPLRQVFIEIPAGKIDPGEEPLATAQRELREETGYIALEWRHLGTMHPCIGYSDERIEVFEARGLSIQGEKQLDHNEFLDVFSLPIEEVKAMIRRGELTDAKTITALSMAALLA